MRDVNIEDSLSYGFTIVAPGSNGEEGILSNARLENVNIPNHGLGTGPRSGLWVRDDARGSLTLINSRIADIQNNSTNFVILSQ